VDAAERSSADYFAVGPVHETPTKPGRPAVGLELVRYAAEHARKPWFAIGGIDTGNAGEVVAAGAERIAVVRALTHASDPLAVARELRAGTAPVG
jgi:thiamine-phosphate pyrophosphorylase